jgi:arylsulfatase A-like enzyme
MVALLACAALLPACGGLAPPDIVLVVVDTLRADHLGAYGYARPTSPRIDALAAEGLWFRRAYAHSSWTLPSLASLLTGLLPHEHRVGRDPADPMRYGRVPPEQETLAEILRARGYRCGAIVNNTYLAPEFALNQGFEEHYDYRGATLTEIRSAEESVDAALSWLREVGSARPRFLLLHLMEPHLSYDPPPAVRHAFTGAGPPPVEVPFGDAEAFAALRSGSRRLAGAELDYVLGLYDEEILAVDRAIGRLLAGLEQAAGGRVAIVLTADHGEEFFERGSFEHGHALWGVLTRVPLVIRAPGLAPGRFEGVVQHVDVFQTILALAGAPRPPGTRGASLLARDPAGGTGDAEVAVSENLLSGPDQTSLADATHRLLVELASRRAQVWSLDRDGLEVARLAEEPARRELDRLAPALERIRGHLDPIAAVAGPRIPDEETLLRLKALGYLDRSDP